MKLVLTGPDRRVCSWEGDVVVDLNRADPRLPATLLGLIERGEAGLDAARDAVQSALSAGGTDDGTVVPLADVSLRPPAVDRPRIACAAGNFAGHTLGSARRKGVEASKALAGLIEGGAMPTAEEVVLLTRQRGTLRGFWKDFALPRGPEDDIPYPDRCERLDYEGEVAVVVGGVAKDVPLGQGAAYIWGVSLFNDLSIREEGGLGGLSFTLGKNWDGSASIGPCIVVGGADPSDLDIETRVNGRLRQRYHTGDMIFSHAEYIEHLSRDFALLPGDMITGGSGPGSATDAEVDLETGEAVTDERRAALYLQVGDVIEITSPTIGTLRNRVVAKRG